MISCQMSSVSLPSGASRPRLDHLDAIRGIAALSVVACHYAITYKSPKWIAWTWGTPLGVWQNGQAAVSLFFVLSGLVLSLRYFRNALSNDLPQFSWIAFVVARVCRIWPPYLVALLISACAMPWWRECFVRPVPTSIVRVAKESMLFLIDTAGGLRYLYVPQAWSLSVELVLSLVLPLGILVAYRSSAWLLVGTAILSILADGSYFLPHFAMGIVIAKHYFEWVDWLEARRRWRWALLAGGLIIYNSNVIEYWPAILVRRHFAEYVTGVGAAMILVSLSAFPRLRGWLSRGVFHAVGRRSFSIYLIHSVVLGIMTPRVLATANLSPAIAWPVGLAFTLAASTLVSGPMYRFVEVPSIAIGRTLSERIRVRRRGLISR